MEQEAHRKKGVFLALLVILSTIANVRTQTVLSNISQLGIGIDEIIGQPPELSLRGTIASFTYLKHQTFAYDGVVYLIPDQISVVNVPMIEKSTTSALYTSLSSVTQSLLAQFSFGFQLPQSFSGMFQASADLNYFKEQEGMYASYTATTYQLYNVWKASIDKAYVFTPEFIDALLKLPSVYNNQTCVDYFRFFDTFGTHFLNQIVFGGMISMSTSFTIAYYNSTTEFEINEDLQQQFELELSKASLNSSGQQRLQQLNSIYNSFFVIAGGYPINYTPDQAEDWAKTISSNPVPLSFEVLLIADIIPDNSSYPKESISIALVDYLSGDQKCFIVSPSVSPSPVPLKSQNPPTISGDDGWSENETWKWLTIAITFIIILICVILMAIGCYFFYKKKQRDKSYGEF